MRSGPRREYRYTTLRPSSRLLCLWVVLALAGGGSLSGQVTSAPQEQSPTAFREAFSLNASRTGETSTSSVDTRRSRGGFFGAGSRSRLSLTGWRALRATRIPERTRANIRVGQVEVRFDVGFGVTFDSNVNLSNDNPISDLILEPTFNINLRWAMSRVNELELQVGLQYQKYLRSVDRDRSGILLDPNTELAYRVFVGDFLFTVYERPSISQDDTNQSGLTNVASFRLFENNAGIIGLWDLNDVLLSAGYDRGDVFSLNDNFTEQDRSTNAFFASVALRLTPTDLGGFRGVFSTTRYREDIQNDFDYIELGAFLESTLSRYTSITVAGGVQHFEFFPTGTPITEQEFITQQETASATGEEITSVPGTLGGGNFTGPFVRAQIFNVLNRYMTQSLALGVEASASSFSNFQEIYFVNYGLQWRWNPRTTFALDLTFEHVNVSGGAGADYDRFILDLGLRRQLSRRFNLTINYIGEVQAAETSVQSYTRNRLEIGLDYNF